MENRRPIETGLRAPPNDTPTDVYPNFSIRIYGLALIALFLHTYVNKARPAIGFINTYT